MKKNLMLIEFQSIGNLSKEKEEEIIRRIFESLISVIPSAQTTVYSGERDVLKKAKGLEEELKRFKKIEEFKEVSERILERVIRGESVDFLEIFKMISNNFPGESQPIELKNHWLFVMYNDIRKNGQEK